MDKLKIEFLAEQICYEKGFLNNIEDDDIQNWNKDKQLGYIKGMEYAKKIMEGYLSTGTC
ncbi:MAG: hypothetical protein GWP19_07970 [Planctomycetia bacterium]|nr:hypothetical protein [Planctomycetia bacterium]